MPVDARRIDEILGDESAIMSKLAASFRGYLGYTARVLYAELRAIGKEDLIRGDLKVIREASDTARALADNIALIRAYHTDIFAAAKYDPPEGVDEKGLLDAVIKQKKREIRALQSAQTDLTTMRPAWGERVGLALEPIPVFLAELEEMIPRPPQLFRIHVSHLWYAHYQIGSTPTPFLMASTYTYTTRPDEWRFDTLNDALVALETEQLSIRFAMKGKFRHRKDKRDNRVKKILDIMREEGREPTGAVRLGRVIGVEAEKVDWDEIFEVPVDSRVVEGDTIRYYDEDDNEIFPISEITEDEMFYYLLFYKTTFRGGRPESAAEYFGRVIQLPVGFRFELIAAITPWRNEELVADLDNGAASFDREAARWR